MIWTRQALEEICKAMPIPIKKLHSDNGSEFINAHVQRFCKEAKIEFTRSRPYRKNNAPYVESKNWSMVRTYTGWRRYDTEEELKILQRLLTFITNEKNQRLKDLSACIAQAGRFKIVISLKNRL